MRRDPSDERFYERLTGSALASVLLHTLLALFVFSVALSSAQEGANESAVGGSIVTLEHRVSVVAQAPARAPEAAPVPHAPRIAPLTHPRYAQPAHVPHPPQHHELSKLAPTAPPQPTPLPQASVQPAPQPTQAAYEPRPQDQLPAVPTSAPTAAVVAVTVTFPPTAAPSPVPSTAPTARPTPRPPAPTAAPRAKPQTPAPSPVPTAAATAVAATKSSAAPSSSPAPVSRASAPPARQPGVPKPRPIRGVPSGGHAAGTHSGSLGRTHGPRRPIAVRPTPSAPPAAKPPKASSGAPNINDRLRALLPHNAVVPNDGAIHTQISIGNGEPTPPPAVLALTKYVFEEGGSGGDAAVKMWVTRVRHDGALTYCDGWMLRYPRSSEPAPMAGTMTNPVAGGIQIGAGSLPGGRGRPIVEAHASTICSARGLQPFAPSPAASP